MRFFRSVIVVSAYLISISSHAEVYKWVDENGRVHFSDKPPVELELNNLSEEEVQTNLSKTQTNLSPGGKPVPSKVVKIPSSASFTNSDILQLRKLLKTHSFLHMNDILDAYQNLSELDITAEDRLFRTYTAFDLPDPALETKFNAWIKSTPDNYQPYLARAKYYYSLGWKSRGGKYSNETKAAQFTAMKKYFGKARRDIDRALSINNKSVLAYGLLISMAKTNSDKHSTELALEQALKINPASLLVRKYYMNSLLPRWGGSYVEMQQFAESAQVYRSRNERLRQLEAMPILDAAKIQYSEKNYLEAENLLNNALLFEESSDVLFARGKNYYRQQKHDLALNDFNRAITIQPEDGDYYYWRSLTNSKLKKYGDALSDIEKASALLPYDESIRKRQQRLTSQTQIPGVEYKTSEQLDPEFEKVIASLNKDPNNAFLYYKKAGMFLQKNQPQRALIDIKKAIELAPEKFEYYYFLDLTAFKLNRLDEIIQYWEKYIALKPNDSRAYLERAGTYFHKQDISQAFKDAKKALDLGNKKAEVFYLKLKAILESRQ